MDEKRLNPEWSQQTAEKVRGRVLPQLERDLVQSVQGITTSETAITRGTPHNPCLLRRAEKPD